MIILILKSIGKAICGTHDDNNFTLLPMSVCNHNRKINREKYNVKLMMMITLISYAGDPARHFYRDTCYPNIFNE